MPSSAEKVILSVSSEALCIPAAAALRKACHKATNYASRHTKRATVPGRAAASPAKVGHFGFTMANTVAIIGNSGWSFPSRTTVTLSGPTVSC